MKKIFLIFKMESSSFVSSNGDRTNKVTFGTDNDVLLSDTEELMVNTSTISHLTKDEVFQDQGNNTYIDFDSYFNVLAQKSQAITQRDAHDKLNDKNFAEDINNRVIELDDYTPNKENKIAFDLDSSVLEKSTPLKIKGLSSEAGGTNIVINVDLKGKSSYDMKSQIQLFYTDGNSTDPTNRPNHETEYFDDNHILWNFYDSSQADGVYRGTINFDAPFQGSVLATSATVTVNHNLDGNIIAEVVNVKGETHRWDYQNDSSYDEAVDEDKNPEPTKPDIDESDEEDFDEDLSTDSGNEPDTDDGENSTDDSNEEDVDSNTDLDTDENESTEDPDGKDIEPDTDTDSSSNPDTDQKPNTDSNSELPITNGSSESSFGQETTPKTQSTRSLSTGKALPNVLETVQNDVATPSSTSKNSSGLFPSTGGTSGLIASILGLALLALLAVFSIIKVIKIRKNN
ncbi:collagen-binding domain-containing protein [Companilactobacillus halodurans]|uniref:collagen-binding domain-containing protein n=1 Tax=Companilactobacillus halodurans TaxID=2584183 RepID=UPI001294FA55|nr:collagen-binding domain-containing protein [Companilactobacillus halodurans]